MADNHTMEELLQAPMEGDVPNDVIKLMMFPYSLEGNARVWYDKEPPNSILTWEDLINKFVNQFFPSLKTTHLKNEISRFTQRFEETFGEAWKRFKEMLRVCPHNGFTELAQIDTFYNGLNDNDQDSLNSATGGNLLSKTTREALQIIKNKSKVCYSRNKPNVFRMNTTSRVNASKSDDMIDKLANQISTLFDIFAKKVIAPAPVIAVEESCVTCGCNHAYYNCLSIDSNQTSVCVTTGTLPSNTIPNPKGEIKAITIRNAVSYEGPLIPTPKKVVKQENEETTDKEQSNFQGSTTHIQPPVTPILEPDVPKTLPKPNIPYPSRLIDQKLCEKATNQMEKFFQIFQDMHFDISFTDALILMPKFASTIKSLLTNKDKLCELAKISLNENCSAMLRKKLSEKLGDPGKSITHPKGVAEDVFVKVGKFHFPIDFVVVDFEADPRVPLILRRSFLRTDRALIDVYGEEITLRVNDKVVTFNLNQTTRYSCTYDDLSVNRIDIIDVAREEYAQGILGFSSNSLGSNPTTTFEPILSDSSPSLTPFEGSDFILEEIDAYLKDESVSPKIDHADCDSEGDICLIEKLLNDDPFQLPPMDLKQGEVVKEKSSIEEPSKLPMTHLLEKETPFVFSKDFIDAFETLKKKLTEAPILVVPDWNLPFKLMCDASDFAIGAVLLLQEFDIIIRDKKGTENLAAEHLSRLENPYKDVFENKDIDENFPSETLGKISSRSTPWFADFANFHAGNFIVKRMSSQQKKKFFKDGVTHRLSTAYHPQTSRQVEVSNRGLKCILKRTVGENRTSWSEKLDDALWAFRTAYKTPIGCTPYKLVYGKSCHLPIELKHKAYWALKHVNFDLKTVGDHQKLQINELNELRDQVYENSLIYKEKTKKIHDSKIKNRFFNVGDRVLLFNSRLKIFSGKLKTRWSGPFTITKVFPYGTVELSQPDGPNFKVNGHRVKHYFGGNVPHLVVPDL
nr:reverse transcriptase domain-containing protein [Tanacetum cinerariifolium]